ncbi:MAG: 50S ribosomal protein L13 [Chloroflexota bacterium]|jgi:large subunit ribosomal protein L13
MNTKTWTPRAAEITRDWYVIDAEGQTLGRLATKISSLLLGKAKPTFTDHLDSGDFVVVVNAAKIIVTSDRLLTKKYHSHSGHPGGYKAETLGDLNARKPTEAIRRAVKGMLPKTKLAAAQIRKLKVYAGPEHPHAPQQPKVIA